MRSISHASEDHFQTAQRMASAGRYEQSLAEYSAAIKATPTHLKALCGRGLALQQLNRHDEALADFAHILALQPDWTGASVTHFARASSLYMLNNFAGTIAECDAALRTTPTHVEAHYLRGIAAMALGDFALAESDMSRTLESESQHLGALSALGKLQLLNGNAALAIESFTRALALASLDSQIAIDCLRLRGVTLQSMSKHAEAIADFTQVVALRPEDINAHFRRAESFDALGETRMAKGDLDRGMLLLQEKRAQFDGELADEDAY